MKNSKIIEAGCLDADGLRVYLGVSRGRAYELMHTQGFPAFYISPRRLVAIKAKVDEWLEAQSEQNA